MTPSTILSLSDDQAQAYLESRLQATLEHSFRTLGGRVMAYLETRGHLPVTFWMEGYDFLAKSLAPALTEGLRMGIERVEPSRTGRNRRFNHNAQMQTVVCQFASELARDVTDQAGCLVGDLLAEEAGLTEVTARLIHRGPLSTASAFQWAVSEARRLLAAGQLLAQPTSPETRGVYMRLLS
ncbi:MAG: hypothetical protein H6672_05490 [Anaerolineaceae bacterium]|nr:hypothetical protein [Anaerolineaceae bacterium]